MALKERLSGVVKKAVPDWLQSELLKFYTFVRKDWNVVKGMTQKEFEVIKDVALIDYNTLRECIGNLNVILRSCNKDRNEQVMFGLRISDKTSLLWKATAKVLCLKINMEQKTVRVTKFLTIAEFWRLRASILEEVRYKNLLQGNIADEFQLIDHEGEEMEHNYHMDNVDETDLPIPCSLTVSGVFARIEKASNEVEKECLICMDHQVEVSLPCAHSFCSKCINMWNDTNKTCPICRDHLEKPEDCWEFTELPDIDEINESVVDLASGRKKSPNER